jgi:LPS-assembly lipoprotein
LWFKPTLIGLICLTLAACGFQPLYGTSSGGQVIAGFSEIQVAPMRDRVGQLLHNELNRLLHPKGVAAKYAYRLTATLSEGKSSLAVKKSAFATRGNLTVTASYNLLQSTTGEIVLSASNPIVVSYNIFSSEFETLMAEKDARKRAIRALAQEIRIKLGVYLRDAARKPAGAS